MKTKTQMRPPLFWGAAAFVVLVMLVATFAALSLRNGLTRTEERLGADVVVMPRTDGKMETAGALLVQGMPAHAYMEESSLAALRGMAGVAQAAPQFFLASAHAGCCSTEVQIIGFDPTADFTIQPWLRERSADALAFGDAIVGSGVSVHADTGLMLYNTPCRVVGRLMPTGTAMDTTVYVNMETVQTMAANAAALHTEHTGAAAPAHGISAVLIRVADGFSPEGVAAAINEACPELSARAANGMVHAAAEELGSFNGMIGALAVSFWLLGMLALGLLYRGIKRDA